LEDALEIFVVRSGVSGRGARGKVLTAKSGVVKLCEIVAVKVADLGR
jgi:hypothetical protein